MAAETGFIIDDIRHEVPTLDTFTMDEAQVLYDYCGLTIEDFAPLTIEDADENDEAIAALNEKLRNPGFLRALMHVAYQRANPKLSAQKVKAIIGTADLLGNFAAFIETEPETDGENDVIPPASTTEPERSSSESSVASNGNGGSDSTNDSEEQADPPTRTTTSDSDTSSASPPTSLAV